MKNIGAFILCVIALALPWRLRVMFANALAWIAQGVNFAIFSILRFMLKNLKKDEARP